MAHTLNTVPLEDGFYLPAEYEEHYQTWLIWPERTDIYPFGAKPVQNTYVQLAHIISKFESVTMCVSKHQYKNARSKLNSNIRLVEMSSNGGWVRDTGPTFLKNINNDIRGIHWGFNAWGNTGYYPYDQDKLVAQKILEIENIDRYSCNLILEGGSINSDGEGTLLITEESIINVNRNPNLNKEQVEFLLKNYLSVQKIIWLKKGIYLDEAGGHIDGLCCFLKPGIVALTWTNDQSDPQYDISFEAYEILSNSTDAKGRNIEVVKIHQPNPCYVSTEESFWIDKIDGTVSRNAGDRLPATYINFYFINNAIILPKFNDENDDDAESILKSFFPKRQIITIYSREILLGGGNIHCMTQQQPIRKHG